jgi:hypothetical protein
MAALDAIVVLPIRQVVITCHHRCVDKPRPRVEVITIEDVARARGVSVEQLLDNMFRNALMVRNNDGSYAPTHYAIQAGALVFVGHDDADGDDAKTGWDIDINLD